MMSLGLASLNIELHKYSKPSHLYIQKNINILSFPLHH